MTQPTPETMIVCLTVQQLEQIIQNLLTKALEGVKTTQTIIKELEDEPLLNRYEAMAFLRVSDSTLWKWSKGGLLSYKKIGGKVYYKKSELLKFNKNY